MYSHRDTAATPGVSARTRDTRTPVEKQNALGRIGQLFDRHRVKELDPIFPTPFHAVCKVTLFYGAARRPTGLQHLQKLLFPLNRDKKRKVKE